MEFTLPEVSEGVESADVARVLVAAGDTVAAEQVVMEIETEKAVVELPCPHSGVVTKVHVAEGDTVAIGATLLSIDADEGGASKAESEEAKADDGEAKATSEPSASPAQAAAPASAPQPAASVPSGDYDVDLVVIGGGPGGYPAAFDAADHGLNVTLVSDEEIPGGVCLHRGCIPSKALLHVAKLLHETRSASQWGLTYGEPEIDLDKLRGFKEQVVGGLTGGVAQLCKSRGVNLVHARGSFLDAHTLKLDKPDGSTDQLTFQHAILATGSTPAMPGIFNIGDDRVMDSTGALALADVPGRLLVIGGGYIGLEMGSVYAALGSEVTVVEMLDDVLMGADRDLARPLKKKLEAEFAAIHTNTKVLSLTATDDGIVAKLEGEGVDPEMTFDRVLVSVGRVPTSRNVGLENTAVVVTDRGFVEVDDQRRTAEPSIYAIGDVAGDPMLAHKATREAKVAVEAILGEPSAFDNRAIPAVVFTDPEVAWCGLTEQEAKEEGIDVNVIRFPWAASGRAQTISRTEGLTKLIVEPDTERVLGVGIVGPNAGELIAEGVLAIEMGATGRDLAETVHAHPTLSETMMESAEATFGQATHYARPKRK